VTAAVPRRALRAFAHPVLRAGGSAVAGWGTVHGATMVHLKQTPSKEATTAAIAPTGIKRTMSSMETFSNKRISCHNTRPYSR